ncbi:MAG TPA: hypothetical protein VFM70_04670 [Salinimicrobium sp.]|nr:hypothetical protein [Salinimicrobium sp.]
MIHKFPIFLALILFFGCRTTSISNHNKQITVQAVTLAGIGNAKDFVLEKNYNNAALPHLVKPIQLSTTQHTFSNKSFKAFSEAKSIQGKEMDIDYIDSLESKPNFLNINIIDKVALVKQFNNKENEDVQNYLENKKEARIVTGLSLVFSTSKMNAILEADNVYLAEEGNKAYVLQLRTNGKTTQTISFSEAVVFAFKTEKFCWKENERHQVVIADIIDISETCSGETYPSAKRAKKEIDYFKF